jgi:putative ATP-dependent endonuclease of OLD family
LRLSRVVIKNLRSVQFADVPLAEPTTLVIGENNTGKSSFIHALRLCLDVGLSSAFRMLLKDDVHCTIDQTQPFQVLVGVEFTGFEGNENEEALLHGTQIGENRARLFYRFRPKRAVRELLARGDLGRPLSLEDFGWELFGGGNPAIDLTAFEWNTENADIGASSVGLQYLQSYLVAFLPALRDVETDLQQSRRSSLMRLIEASNIGAAEQQSLIDAVRTANTQIEGSPTIQAIAASIDSSLKEITGPAFSLDVELGLSSPTFQAIVRNLIVLLSNPTVRQFEPRRNGLGLNNILYIAILIEHFRKRAAAGKSAGELILIEEPEAHLHPQLQATLMAALRELPFQVIATTHSTQVTSKAPLSSFVMLTHRPGGAPAVTTPLASPALSLTDRHDLERYLDATKSNLLFARRVMLVEGAAELLLLPPLVKKVLGIDLEREGISLVAIHGVHFGPFSRLFSDACLPKRCAIVADADLDVGDLPDGDDPVENPNLALLEGPYVRAFVGATTFEREITLDTNLPMLAATAAALGAPRVQSDLEMQDLIGGPVPEALKDKVLRTAKRFGKARFAQVAARHVDQAGALPAYVTDAIAWLREA